MTEQFVVSSPQQTIPRGGIPIKAKITIPYLVLTLILAIAAAFLITQLVVENVEERFNKQLFEAGKIASELVVGYESQLLESLRLLANVQGVPESIYSNDPNSLRTLTLGVIANDQREAVEFIDADGNHVLSVKHRTGGNPEDYEFSTGGQSFYTNLEIVQNVLDQKNDGKGDKFADLVRTDTGDYLYVSGPVYNDQGRFTGVILVGMSLPKMAIEIRANTFAQVTFYDPAGEVMYSTLPFSQDLAADSIEQTISFKDVSSSKRELENQRDLDVANISFSEILGVFEVRRNHELGVLGLSLSRNAIVQTSSTSRWRIFMLVATANFFIILLGINLANRITKPLLQLVQASVKVTEGDLNVVVKPESNDEVAVLTESFNKMLASISSAQRDLLKSYDDTLEGWAKALELRDKETEGHSTRVTELTVRLAGEMGIEWEELINIRRGALLHDIGKMGTPDAILHKEGPLTDEERLIIQKHPQDAYDMLSKVGYLRLAIDIPYCHHEKWNGTGYPRGLKGEEIPLSARMFAIVDVWDALTNDRPYRKALPREEVIDYLKSESGKHFDPKVVEAFIQIIDGSDGEG